MIKLANMWQPYEVEDAILKVLSSGVFVKGEEVETFENTWAEYCGMKYAIAVSSGAMALELVIQIKTAVGDSVTTQHDSYKAVRNAIRRLDRTYIPNDVIPDIFVHHLHDQKLDYIPLIEDCSHVHGYQPVTETAIFSFYPTKILGAIGDAGIIVTNSDHVNDLARELRNHGQPDGTNARMDEIQAAALLAKMPYLDSFIKRRREIVKMYDKGLGRKTPGKFHYAYCIPGSEEKKEKLLKMGVESAFYYKPDYMALPLNPMLSNAEVEEVISCVLAL